MKLGARIIKTGIAVSISLYVAKLAGLSPVLFAALAAVLAVQPSLYRSWQNILDQLQANIIGAVLAVLFTSLLGNEPFVVGMVVILVIAVNIQFKFEKSIPLSIVTVIAIMESTTGNFFIFALERFTLIMTGIGASFLVNVIFLPPRYEDKLYAKVHDLNQHIMGYLRSCTYHEYEERLYKEETKRLREEFIECEQLYLLFKEERTYLRKVKYSKTRTLVLFREMLKVTNQALYLLTQFEKHQSDLTQMSEELQAMIDREVDVLCNYHEKILLKYEGKIKSQHPHLPYEEASEGRRLLLEKYLQMVPSALLNDKHIEDESTIKHGALKTPYESHEDDILSGDAAINLFPLIAQIIDYSNALERLDKLVEGYQTFH
ncbi:FUSC family protein [Caldalkalibacillus salinus]|uniref:FUSC family protein n=1 Tax=Caldalkalibacillus salinus TaxID=2803787 RepID=UPI001923735E|nr:aromatic acid exporter family protein [Caldalkalibacillus salinus]